MRIAVNTRLLLKDRLEGIGRFAHEILSRLVHMMPEHEFHFLFDRPFDSEFIYADNVEGHVLFPQARHPFLYNWWFHHSTPRKLREIKADLYFSPEGYLSLGATIPQVNVLHDINFEHFPEMLPIMHRWHFRRYFPKYAQVATETLTVSEFSAQDIHKRYGVPKEKIHVVYNGVSSEFSPLSAEARQACMNIWSQGKPFFLFVGALHPRKNINTLLQAFDRFKATSSSQHKLLLVGKKAFKNEEMEAIYESMSYKKDVVFTGRLSDSDLRIVLASASALVFVPVFEGFGIPIIEAMKSGTPVICSDNSALPEVAGDAALFVNPKSIADIAENMGLLNEDQNLRKRLTERGLLRANHFSWDKSVKQVANILSKHLEQT